MAEYTADFEAGVDAATITTGAGEASATAWWIVNGTPSYSNTHAHGSLSAKIDGSDSGVDLAWTGITDGFGRVYLYATANPTIDLCAVVFYNGVGGIEANSDGKVSVADSVGNRYYTTSSIPLNQWVRLEYQIVFSTTVGQITLKVFSGESSTPTETLTTPANLNTSAAPDWMSFRCRSWGSDVWIDDLVANATTWSGPSGGAAVQTLVASADSVDGAWTDQAGGSSLSAAIDESSASDADYIMSELSPNASACRVKLEAGGDPAASDGHVIHWRIRKSSPGGETINGTVKLYQGGGNSLGAGTLIADFDRTNVSGSSWTTFDETLSGGEADAITDYGDLYLEFHADTP